MITVFSKSVLSVYPFQPTVCVSIMKRFWLTSSQRYYPSIIYDEVRRGGQEPILAGTDREAEYTMDRSPVHCRTNTDRRACTPTLTPTKMLYHR